MELQFISIFSLRKKYIYNFATTKLVLLPSFKLGSKSLLPPKKNEFLGLQLFLQRGPWTLLNASWLQVSSHAVQQFVITHEFWLHVFVSIC